MPTRALLCFTAGLQIAHVLFDGGVRMMIGKAAVHLDIESDGLEAHLAHQRRRDHAAAAVAAIDRDLHSGLKLMWLLMYRDSRAAPAARSTRRFAAR